MVPRPPPLSEFLQNAWRWLARGSRWRRSVSDSPGHFLPAEPRRPSREAFIHKQPKQVPRGLVPKVKFWEVRRDDWEEMGAFWLWHIMQGSGS